MRTNILTQLCSIPTAPFAERYVAEYARRFASERGLKLSSDRFGNLLIAMPGKSGNERLVFTAHMDHPGFIAEEMVDKRTLRAAFRGYVLSKYMVDTKVRFFDGLQEISGVVLKTSNERSERPEVPTSALVRLKKPVTAGAVGMFDQGPGRIRGGKFFSRVCDDLAGAAACLTMLDELSKNHARAPVAVLLTRAEEEGFIGAIGAARYPGLLRKSDRIIAIECSAAQPYAPQGAGAIIRVGDRTSVFNSALTYFLSAQAEALAKSNKRFKYQRALMPGGTCEATVYDIYGFMAASICVALGNYHNMDHKQHRISPEFIDLEDWKNMAALFVQVARNAHTFKPGHKQLKERVEKRFGKLRRLLNDSSRRNSVR